VSGGPDRDRDPLDTAGDETPVRITDMSMTERWAPLVVDPDQPAAFQPPRHALRALVAAACLIVVGLVLWAL
jgi:hypothetical protein